mmetsp:Transcript_7441/g.22005  ORF Transcript_7441/g.22005 Transcript_7441/m.22005 type:complete len:292 (+) Transcript_7441:847-1722(+)
MSGWFSSRWKAPTSYQRHAEISLGSGFMVWPGRGSRRTTQYTSLLPQGWSPCRCQRPSTDTGRHATPVSSKVSRAAHSKKDSPASAMPPGSFHCGDGTRSLASGVWRHSLTTSSSLASLTTKPAQPTCVLPHGGTLSSPAPSHAYNTSSSPSAWCAAKPCRAAAAARPALLRGSWSQPLSAPSARQRSFLEASQRPNAASSGHDGASAARRSTSTPRYGSCFSSTATVGARAANRTVCARAARAPGRSSSGLHLLDSSNMSSARDVATMRPGRRPRATLELLASSSRVLWG